MQVSATPAPAAAKTPEVLKPAKQKMSAQRRFTIVGVAAAVLFLVAALSPPALLGHLTVFALAIVIGYYVIGHVHHALHTPLMSVTNAISGIIVTGALLQIGHRTRRMAADHVAGVRGDPAGLHQRVRRVRGDPPDARHVLPSLIGELSR